MSMMKNRVEDIGIIWEASKEDGLFCNIGDLVVDNKVDRDSLRLDVVFAFKKTTFRDIAEYLFGKAEVYIKAPKLMSLVYVVVMYAISPKSTSVRLLDDDEFREIEGFFKLKSGEWFVEKKDVENIQGSLEILDVLKRSKIVEEDGDRYYVVGHLLKNLKINMEV